MGESKKVNLSKSIDACNQLSNALVMLRTALDQKKKSLDEAKADFNKQLAEKEASFESLKLSATQALASMEDIIYKLNNVLDKDGSGNNNN